ncbi:MAG TPA: SAM-dependent methyltransferase [Acetobacteraceae bacterium]|jgi:NADH dehydrogenase [ubiquinone] 1 alpha subcomplex assembly factor 7|nr:SAM-dependent methyltransferase [Acetobacteraceae bacterium]
MERLDHYMARANAAYYATCDPFRDFTTAPEISQVFGEILGLWAAVTWDLLGRPMPVLLVEAGPGRGTLMADALRAIATVAPEFRAALRLHLVETSPRLRAIQAERLPDAVWHDGLDTLPDAPILLLANEFLDALPIRQFVRHGGRWFERFVDQGRFLECAATPSPTLPRFAGEGVFRPLPCEAGEGRGEGEAIVTEFSEAAIALARSLASRLATRPGAALFLDYGPEHSAPGDSLQALRDGHPADPLSDPGTADLTAHVDFAAFASAARDAGAATHGPLPQGLFLTRLGLFQRTDRLARTQPPSRAAALFEAARRLAEPSRMGHLFKALAVCHPSCPSPPGFEADSP